MSTTTSPQVIFNVKDNSIDAIADIEELPLVKQFYMFKAQKGSATPKWFSSYAAVEKEYGAETFNENNSTYFSKSAMYAKQVAGDSPICCMRLIPDTAVKANLVFYVTLQAADVQQYEKAADGTRLLDINGDWVPLDDGGTPVVLPGYNVTWSAEHLQAGETIDSLTVTTTVVPMEEDAVKYPIFAMEYSSPCALGNNFGTELYYNVNENGIDKIELTKNIMYSLRIKEILYNSSSVKSVQNAYGGVETSFVFPSNVIDTSLNMNISINDVIGNYFDESAPFPFDIHVYEDNYKTVDGLIKAALTEDEEDSLGALLNDPGAYIINIISAINPLTGIEYDGVNLVNTVAARNSTQYLTGGSDGTMTQSIEYELVRDVLSLAAYPALEDAARFPFNCVVDSGYDLTTKYAFIDFLDVRKDVFAILGTYQTGIDELDEAEDLAVGQTLHNRALLSQESVLFGTDVCRAIILGQSGVPNVSVKNTIVPAGTYWLATKLASQYNKTFIDTPLVTWPYSMNDLFKSLNWYPVKGSFKNKLYGAAINYCQFYDRSQLHYPALRSVYPYVTSKLVDFEFMMVTVFTHQLVREIGARFFGSEEAANIRHARIKADIEKELGNIVNNKYPFTVEVNQTVAEAAAGFIDHAYINFTANNAMTLLKVDLIVNNPS